MLYLRAEDRVVLNGSGGVLGAVMAVGVDFETVTGFGGGGGGGHNRSPSLSTIDPRTTSSSKFIKKLSFEPGTKKYYKQYNSYKNCGIF